MAARHSDKRCSLSKSHRRLSCQALVDISLALESGHFCVDSPYILLRELYISLMPPFSTGIYVSFVHGQLLPLAAMLESPLKITKRPYQFV